MGRTGRPNLIHCAIGAGLRMTGTEPHAPRGTAGRGLNWDRGPRRSCTALILSQALKDSGLFMLSHPGLSLAVQVALAPAP
jgi:hypothetical protein